MSNKLFTDFPPVSTDQWEAAITKDLKGADYEKKLVWKTPDGFKVKPYYREDDLQKITYLQSNPAEFPYVRGNSADNNAWEIRQDICAKEASKINAIARDAIARGAQGVGLMATQVENAQDMETLLASIDPTKTAIHFVKSKNYGKTLELFVQYLQKKGIDAKKVKGSINFDFFAYALEHGGFYASLEENVQECKQLFDTYAQTLPLFRLLSVNAAILHNAGATATQELGYGLNWANEYVYLLTQAGVKIQTITPRMTFHLAVGSNYFMEIAKIRAARLLWAYVMKEYKAETMTVFVHASTSHWNKSVFDPYVNMLRTTTESMSAAIGGADSIHVDGFDTSYKCADDFSSRIARNQQIILKEESYMDKIVDPAAGSYYIENLTDALAQHAWSLFLEIEAQGGFVKAFQAGTLQDAVAATAQQRDMDIANRKITILGTNQYPNALEKMADKIKDNCCGCNAQKGDYKKLRMYRGAEAFEGLRLASEKAGAKKPVVFLMTYGSLAMRKARAGFAQNFFGCAGYQIIDNPGFKTIEEGVKAALDAKANIVVLCSSDEDYLEMVPAACAALNGKVNITLAGHPGENQEAFKAAGVQEFIHVKSNLITTLTNYHKAFGLL